MARPKIKIERAPFDYLIDGIGLLSLIILVALPAYYYGGLPDEIPSHYGINGEPDDYSAKATIWIMPVIGIIIYFTLALLSRYPHTYNYPTEITEDNSRRLYGIAVRMMRVMNTIIIMVFAYLMFSTIQIALGLQSGLGNHFVLGFIVFFCAAMVYFLFKTLKSK